VYLRRFGLYLQNHRPELERPSLEIPKASAFFCAFLTCSILSIFLFPITSFAEDTQASPTQSTNRSDISSNSRTASKKFRTIISPTLDNHNSIGSRKTTARKINSRKNIGSTDNLLDTPIEGRASVGSEAFLDELDEFEDEDQIPETDLNGFDHLVTGFALEGHHATSDCLGCHVDGVFNELPTQCSACHDGAFTTGKSLDHINTNEDCALCHNAFGFKNLSISLFNHNLIGTATCLSCHDGIKAAGKSPRHVPSANTCESCHSFLGWLPATFDHVDITQSCVFCHSPNGYSKFYKTLSHINTTELCES